MVRYYCDRCGTETTQVQDRVRVGTRAIDHEARDQRMEVGVPGYRHLERDMCAPCATKTYNKIADILAAVHLTHDER